ncbi:MAG: porin [Elusimicrobia bacterium]|nr:porin [Elusimicrobiota bacterium]
MKSKFVRLMAVAVAVSGSMAGSARAEEKKTEVKLYMQEMYSATSDKTPDSFSMRLARIVFSGKPNTDWAYSFQLDASQQPALLDAYLDFSRENVLPKAFAFKLRAGQFKVPFSMEHLAGDSDLDTVNRSQAVNALTPARPDTKGRDIGASLQLTASPWQIKKLAEITVGQFNGEGANATDKNHRKGLALRGVFNPSAAISFGASYYDGTRFSTATATTRLGTELSLTWGRAYLKGEYVRGKANSLNNVRPANAEGWYAQAAFFVVPKVLQAVAKYDVYDPDIERSSGRDYKYASTVKKSAISVVGVNWNFADNMKLQTNYEWKYWVKGGIVSNTFETVLAMTF